MNEKTQERSWTPEEIEAVRAEAKALMLRDRVTQVQMSREVGKPVGTMSSWLGGTYAGRNDELAVLAERWLRAREERAQVQTKVLRAPRFMATPTSDQVMDVLYHAQHLPDFAVITGPAGIGKSSTLCEYTRTRNNVWKLVAEPIHQRMSAFLEDLSLVMGVQPVGSADRRSKQICSRALGSGALFIIDEAQHLPSPVLDQLRSIHDKTGCGLVLAGNDTIFGRLGTGKAAYAQLHSRIGMRLQLPNSGKGDIAVLADAWGIKNELSRALLTAIGRRPGALRKVSKTMQIAHMLAAAEGREVEPGDIRTAHARLDNTPLAGEAA